MNLQIVPYAPDHEPAWEQCCAASVNATLLHTRRFLSYHGERFKDVSALILDAGKVRGVFPAAQSPADPMLVVSHPGTTYGGVVHPGWLSGARMLEALSALAAHYQNLGYQRLLYKAVPHIYASAPAQDDLYALFRLGAQRLRCDLSCAVGLARRQPPDAQRRRGLKKAQKAVTLSAEPLHLGALWAVIAHNLARKHAAKPVHSLAELALLMNRFPHHIAIHCALLAGCVEAGVVVFKTSTVWHAQYIAASESAYAVSALDAVFDAVILEAQQAGARYFDFGISNEQDGQVLNDGLYRFKSGFGGGGVAHEFYEIKLCNAS
ncbi:GNAT family N-acetyltransferase [Rhodoferax sp.]|uniref:GNAT family N-acetyltransferase n=1 Tax=Rhodoferax sp. TaxID=50421 RepID=UPI0019FBFDC7|nr:GNAT family N-acetyltransferase [Rhodoferax sp.]MBE0474958.1 GNAT family N-acetyltransferase [Rhodoferax sp.]